MGYVIGNVLLISPSAYQAFLIFSSPLAVWGNKKNRRGAL